MDGSPREYARDDGKGDLFDGFGGLGNGLGGFVEDVDVDADTFFDSDDATNLTNSFDDFTGFTYYTPHVFWINFNAQGN
jgi:hypothetical protein